ncbi:PQQ-dependent sugar dehydrogenase [Aquiflexum lacus]|uniref:PQQ-dependent sugar dehydrogenase n=1 Tax=Aquiflexum lacus TaxID=2483805 RepID=UPI0018961CA1|nr:PQQ-dependent sugar dehydrogenase [Aquiflexum lacus]
MIAFPKNSGNFFYSIVKTKIIFLLFLGFATACKEHSKEVESIRPDDSRFTPTVVVEGLEEPLQIEFDDNGYVYWIERIGNVKRFNEKTGEVEMLGTLDLTKETAPGLIGILLDRDFESSQQIYLFYSAAADKGDALRLSRFELGKDGLLDIANEKIILSVPWEQPDGQHFGGGMTWDKNGNLYLSIGADSHPTQYSPLPFKNEGGRGEDEARTAGNTNDLRGTIIRIKPHADGTYSIPEGNLFAQDSPNTLPEIYIMGNRNPWRLSIDSKTQYLHWGEVGPDAGVDSEEFGPMGYDEFNVSKGPGNYGWPYFIGYNRAYNSYDYNTGVYGAPYRPDSSYNDSPNNTGLKILPPAKKALIAYPYQVSEEWPILGSAARSAVGGPIFRRNDFSENVERMFPAYFEGKWFITDYVRNWIMVVEMDESRSKVLSLEKFLPAEMLTHSQPLDMDFSPNGDLYLVEYGIGGQGKISRIEYNAGNRAPIAKASSSAMDGKVPLNLKLSSEGSMDMDGDPLTYNWTIKGMDGKIVQDFTDPNPTLILEEPGKYFVNLKVKDSYGLSSEDSFQIIAGNSRPQVKFQILEGNQSFYFPEGMIEYVLSVEDKEDGSLMDGMIKKEKVLVTAQYIPSGMGYPQLELLEMQDKLNPEIRLKHLNAKGLVQKSNCLSCHLEDRKLVGPSFQDIAKRYKEDPKAFEILSKSIADGGSGKWGDSPMPPQPMLNSPEITQIIDYILEINSENQENTNLGTSGQYQTKAYNKRGRGKRLDSYFRTPLEMGSYVFLASYTDKGSEEKDGLNLDGKDYFLLRYPVLAPEDADIFSEKGISYTPSTNDPGFIFTGRGGHIGFRAIDLSGINQIKIGAPNRFWHWSHFVGATIELRSGNPEGQIIGEAYTIPPAPKGDKGPFFGEAMGLPATFDVSKSDGLHDLYIVVKNLQANESDALVMMTGIEFIK